MSEYQDIIIGSGLNSLVCAALLAKAGRRVCVLERNAKLGGCIVTEEATLPGFQHDLLSSWHPLFVTSAAYQELQEELEKHGLHYLFTEKPIAGLTSEQQSLVLTRSRDRNAEALGDEAAVYLAAMQEVESNAELIFPLLSQQLRRWRFAWVLLKNAHRLGIAGLSDFLKTALGSVRDWLEPKTGDKAFQACIAPWVLHVGLGPQAPTSALMAKVVLYSLEAVGLPVVNGGSYKLVEAFVGVIEAYGGELHVNSEVDEVVVQGTRATGVKLADGTLIEAGDHIICNVTPQQLYGRLLPQSASSETVRAQAAQYRFGRADMQIHIAMSEPAQWCREELNDVAMVHISDGLDSFSRAVNQAERGLLPETATIVVGQPCAVDPSRAPQGQWILWLQLQELPSVVKGDAAGKISPPEDGQWSEELKEKYAERVINRLSQHIPNLRSAELKRLVLSPKDLERMNCNLVGGDPYSGDCAIDQNLFLRPFSRSSNHDTAVRNVFHIGASTHPGPGLNGGSGYLVAKQLS